MNPHTVQDVLQTLVPVPFLLPQSLPRQQAGLIGWEAPPTPLPRPSTKMQNHKNAKSKSVSRVLSLLPPLCLRSGDKGVNKRSLLLDISSSLSSDVTPSPQFPITQAGEGCILRGHRIFCSPSSLSPLPHPRSASPWQNQGGPNEESPGASEAQPAGPCDVLGPAGEGPLLLLVSHEDDGARSRWGHQSYHRGLSPASCA